MPKVQELDTEQDRREEDCQLGSCSNQGRVSTDESASVREKLMQDKVAMGQR